MSFVEIVRLSKTHRSGTMITPVLRDVSLRFSRGTFNAVVGPSGCGKSTLLSLIGGVDRADRGHLFVDGVDLVGATDADLVWHRRERIGFVFQFFNLLPSLTAVENVECGLEFLPLTRRARRERALDYLESVGLEDKAARFPSQLSGGEQQRVAIARAMAREPSLLLADEPTGNLDGETGERVLDTMRRLQRETGVTCVLVTHDASLASTADEIVRLKDGRIAAPPALVAPPAGSGVRLAGNWR